METRPFGRTGIEVSRIGLGCYGMSGAYGAADDRESIATIHRAIDLGVNLLDTSASYGAGHNHGLIGRAVRDRRDPCVHPFEDRLDPLSGWHVDARRRRHARTAPRGL